MDESDCCPLIGNPASLLPERLSSIKQIIGDHQELPVPATQLLSEVSLDYSRSKMPYPSYSPPLERLCILRI
jgi:hypothetical protein